VRSVRSSRQVPRSLKFVARRGYADEQQLAACSSMPFTTVPVSVANTAAVESGKWWLLYIAGCPFGGRRGKENGLGQTHGIKTGGDGLGHGFHIVSID